LLHYMLLADLGHGKLVNLKKQTVEHEFVNTTLRPSDRVQFKIADAQWNDTPPGAERFRSLLTALLQDLGTGLDLALYEDALTHLLGGDDRVVANVQVRMADSMLGHQRIHLAAPRVAFVLTALPQPDADYESHSRRLLRHCALEAVLWANINLKTVTFTTIRS
jgi:hypothetical protein